MPVPSVDEVAGACSIVDAGAVAILGTHPHITRPVVRYRDAIITYSLGNFFGDATRFATPMGFLDPG